jgi:hypothetical protein
MGYAWWTDDLFIEGTVVTGSIGATWAVVDAFDNEPLDKDYSDVAAWVVGDTLHVWVTNAYPSITYTVVWQIHNTGTIPIHFNDPIITEDLPPLATFNFTGPSIPIVWTTLQLHPTYHQMGQLYVHLGCDTLEGTTYTFSIDLVYGQWNAPDPLPFP